MHASKKHILLRYLAYAKPHRGLLLIVLISGIIKFNFPLIPAKIFQLITDRIIWNEVGLDITARQNLLITYAIILFFVSVIAAIATFFRAYATVRTSAAIAFDLRQSLWQHLQRLSLSFHQSRPVGSLTSRLMSDVAVSQQMITGGIVNVFLDSVCMIFAVAMMLTISWKLTLVVLAVLPAYTLLYRKINPRIRQASREVQRQRAALSGSAVERLGGIAIIQSFAQEPAEARHFADQADELRDRSVKRGRLNCTLNSCGEMFISIATYAIWIVGGYFAINESLTPGQIIQFAIVANQVYMPLRRFGQINVVYQTSMAAIERVFAIFDITPQIRDKTDTPDRIPGISEIRFKDVVFRYDEDGRSILKEISFSVAPGEKVAIVGESGAGKSTLVTLIPRLHDISEGSISIDGIDIRDYPLRRLRRSIGIVLQEPILFSGSVRENLLYGSKKASDEEIIAAAEAANAHDFISAMPDGYDTLIGERGVKLSGGQRQRLSLARTVLQNPRILILDEATSSLDSESENLIVEALDRVMSGRTCIVIAHRLSTILNADRILVLQQGRLVEQGPHLELLAAGGYYSYLFDQQFGPLQKLVSDEYRKD